MKVIFTKNEMAACHAASGNVVLELAKAGVMLSSQQCEEVLKAAEEGRLQELLESGESPFVKQENGDWEFQSPESINVAYATLIATNAALIVRIGTKVAAAATTLKYLGGLLKELFRPTPEERQQLSAFRDDLKAINSSIQAYYK